MPAAYYARPYVIRDYRECHLRPPPRGAHWVRVNGDVVLAAIATGIVLDVLYNHYY
ncbi:MAG TPA: RcnB family protein [Steroidobacteraceae bacterium]